MNQMTPAMTAGPLRAETRIELADPVATLDQLREHFAEHGAVSGDPAAWGVTFSIGSAAARLEERAACFTVEAGDESSLAFLQWSVAEHVAEFAGAAPEIVWEGGTKPGAALPYFREMTVKAARQITPRMRRLTLAGRDLGRFARDGMHIRLLLAPRPGVAPVWPVMAADGRQAWPDGERPIPRVYTIRRIDVAAGEIDIDFVLHEGDEMPGARFGAEAVPGMTVGMTGPGGGGPEDARFTLLAGDETALPAIGRILAEMPAGRRVKALIEIADDGERQDLPSAADLDLVWLSREGRPAGTTTLIEDAVRAFDLPEAPEHSFIWVGCEHAAARTIRKHVRAEKGLSRRNHLVMAYWRRGVAGEPEHE